MFATLKNAWKVDDIRKKIIYTFIVLFLFRLGCAIPVPFIDKDALAELFNSSSVAGSALGIMNLLSGDSFSHATLFALSISPYITASIVMQLLAVAIPALENMAKSGPEGQQKMARITRYLTVALSLVMAYGYYATIRGNGLVINDSWFTCLVIIASFTAGACIIMWMGERIDEKGIGNGISMILFVSILSRGGQLAYMAWEAIKNNPINIIYVALVLAFMAVVILLVVHITNAERRLAVQYAKRQVGRRVYGGNNTFLPLKLNMTGVMPIIFAQAIVSIPSTLSLIFPSWQNGISTWFSGSSPYPFYAILYLLMIVAFAYFYTSISFNPMEVASNLQKNGGTILGYRPGRATADYIHKILNRVTLMGAIFLGFIAIFPILFVMVYRWTGTEATAIFSSLAFGGTSLLIIVGVALETTRDLEAQISMRHYKGFLD